MAFDYPVNLDLEGRHAVVFGGGPLACERVHGLIESGAIVTIVTPEATNECRRRACNGDLVLLERRARPADLKGAFIAICTREDDAPVDKLYAAARKHGVLFAALDDIPHCMFSAMDALDDLAGLIEAVGDDRRDDVIRHVLDRIKPDAVSAET